MIFLIIYLIVSLYVLISTFITFNIQSKLGGKAGIENLRNYLNFSNIFLSKRRRNELKWHGLINQYFLSVLQIIYSALLWPVGMVAYTLLVPKRVKNKGILAVTQYGALFPRYIIYLIALAMIGIFLLVKRTDLVGSKLLFCMFMLYFILVLTDLIINFTNSGSIIKKYKSSYFSIRYNVITNYALVIINTFLCSLLLWVTLSPIPIDLKVLNLVKNELVGVNTLSILLSGELDNIQKLTFLNYLLASIGLVLKLSILNQALKAWVVKKEQSDYLSILIALINIGFYKKALPYVEKIKNQEEKKDIRIVELTVLLANDLFSDVKNKIKEYTSVTPKSSLDTEYFSLISFSWQCGLPLYNLLYMYTVWLTEIKSEGYLSMTLEAVLTQSPEGLKYLKKLIQDEGLSQYMPLAMYSLHILLKEDYDINSLNVYLDSDEINIEKIFTLKLCFIEYFFLNDIKKVEFIIDELDKCVLNSTILNDIDKYFLFTTVTSMLAISESDKNLYDKNLIEALNDRKSYLTDKMGSNKNFLNYLDGLVDDVF